MMNILVFIFTTSLFFFKALHAPVVDAYPDGAGGCRGGRAAVGWPHRVLDIVRPIVKRSLTAAKLDIVFSGETVAMGSTVNRTVDTYHDIVVTGQNGETYKGILIRIETTDGTNTTGVLSPDAYLQNAKVCKIPVVGITHTSNSPKHSVGGTIKFPTPTNGVLIDITIVFENEWESSFAYGRIKANFVPKQA